METALLKTNILSIISSGLVMALLGFVLYLFRDAAAPYMRFLLTIPPVGVAAYIYIFNLYRKFNGVLPQDRFQVLLDLLVATVTAAGVFIVFSALLLLLIGILSR